MNKAVSVAKLEANRRMQTFGTPLFVELGMIAVLLLVFGAFQRMAPDRLVTGEVATNPNLTTNVFGVLCGMASVMVVLGAQSLAINFPLTRAFGVGVKSMMLGTYLYYILTAAYFTLITLMFYGIELLTNGWFIDVILFRDLTFGGNGLNLAIIVFIGALFASTLGGAFGTIWLRFGNLGLWAAVGVLLLSLGGLLFAAAPALIDFFSQLTQLSVLVGLFVAGLLLAALAGLVMRGMALRTS